MMADVCTAPSTGGGFLSGTLNYLDCQAQSIGELGYQALSGPGSSVALALTALLTVFIAIYGIRLLLGASLAFNEIVIGVLKIGIVLTIATSWSAYRVVIYDTVMHGPAEIVQQIGRGAGLAGSDGGLVAHLQAVDDAIQSFASVGSGRFDLGSVPAAASVNGLPPTKPVVADNYAFGFARTLYLSGAIGALGFVHIVAGMLLALAPLPVVALHPAIVKDYRRKVLDLQTAIADPDAGPQATTALRSLIERIVLTPNPKDRGVAIKVEGRLAGIIALATGREPPEALTVKMERVKGIEPSS